jgi:hypothetical protein
MFSPIGPAGPDYLDARPRSLVATRLRAVLLENLRIKRHHILFLEGEFFGETPP